MYGAQILSAAAIGLFLGRGHSFCKEEKTAENKRFSINMIPKAISDSVLPMLNICAFVCFFSAVAVSVESLLNFVNAPDWLYLFSVGALELTNGINALSGGEICHSTMLFAGFFIGWSGLSVVLQSVSILSKCGLSVKKFVWFKLIQGGLCAFICICGGKLLNLY